MLDLILPLHLVMKETRRTGLDPVPIVKRLQTIQ